MDTLIWTIDAIARETMLFAAVGFLIGGIDDLAIDLIWFARLARARFGAPLSVARLTPAAAQGRLAIFVAAWRESHVIAPMLTAALARFDHPDYRIYVGAYPNDPATIDAIAGVAERDDRVRLVIGANPGPTTKADNLNAVWRALVSDDAASGTRTRAIVIHDAEDVVDPGELAVYDALLGDHAVVQIPVVPLIDDGARLVSGHYADEFAESHMKTLVVRAALGAGLPLAGVGCAIRMDALETIAAAHGQPFDSTSLTEDYEIGLQLGTMGLSACFARVRHDDGSLVAVRAYFPSTIRAAVAQKARWMTGIALAGWDRIGWGRPFDLREHWMRMRDRRAPIAVVVLATAYSALACWSLSWALHGVTKTPPPNTDGTVATLLMINAGLLGWRMAMRAAITTRLYGWREGAWSIPRVLIANYIALLAAKRALAGYLRTLNGAPPRWDKTDHVFPTTLTEVSRG